MVNREEICIVGWSGDVRPFLCHREERGSRDNQKALLGRGLTWVKGSSGMSGGWAESPILPSALGLSSPGRRVPGEAGQGRHSSRTPLLFSAGLSAPGWSCSPFRPNLVSLDLGFNDLTDLQSMVASLRTLQYLRLLVLQGNPLALVPYYRGFTIDSLSGLCVLDDITVASSEKHQFRGLGHSGGEGAGGRGGGVPCSLIHHPVGCTGVCVTHPPWLTQTLVRCGSLLGQISLRDFHPCN